MSIDEQLQYTATAVDDIQAAINEKGVVVDATIPLASYGDKIRAISGGSAVEAPHEVRFFDYDGFLLSQQNIETGKAAVFPQAPAHEDLEFIGWTHTQEQLSNLQYRTTERPEVIIPGHVDVGAMYRTKDFVTHLYVEPNAGGGRVVTVYLIKAVINATVYIDWGDGLTDTVTVTSVSAKAHTYAADGSYHIKITSEGNATYGLGSGTTAAPIVTTGNALVTKVLLADNVLLRSYAMYNFVNVNAVLLPAPGVNTELPLGCFQNANSLPHVSMPLGYTVFPKDFVNSATSLASLVIAWSITEFEAQGMYLVPFLNRVVFAPAVTTLPDKFLNLGSAANVISNVITSVGLAAFESYYCLTTFNMPKRLVSAGGAVIANVYNLNLQDLEIYFTGAFTSMSWLQKLRGTLIVRGAANVTIFAGVANFNNISKLVIGSNFLSTTGAFTNKECNSYVFEGRPPDLGSSSHVSGINKIAKIYVPDEYVAETKTRTGWTSVANYIFPVSQMPV